MLQSMNRLLNRLMPIITPVSIVIGLLCGSRLSSFTYLSPWLFAFMTFAGSISLGFKDFVNVLKRPLPLIICLFILHLAMPLIAMGFGHLVYPGDMYMITGLILAASIPTGVSTFVWVSMYKGNIALTLSIILIDTMLAPFLVPGILSLLVGTDVQLDVYDMMSSLFWMIVVPSLIGMILNEWSKGGIAPIWGPRLNPFSKLAMAAIVAINGSVVAPYLTDFSLHLAGLAVVIVVIASTGYLLGLAFSKLMGWSYPDRVALIFNGGMRNISAGAVLAVTYFPAPVAVPVVLGMVFQQMIASLVGYLLGRSVRADKGQSKNAVGL
ncbi:MULTISPECIES: bile acid:sodium symporter family protein [Paenibacillus]|uniref:Bile acid:sodium symporter family protein n=1 Tax=Paenibacillus woosongensis TaxID=307580 RepID=A0A7X3CML4_9BACL|nr:MULTISPECIES: bile acid:sodium symporter family protein [Paenibacillus]MUG45325.1 bile acid:sodium symporter family protein [Paenibacillus woosongensis]